MSRVVWKEGKVVSVKIRDDLYCLAQMLNSPYMIFFESYSADGEWGDIDLDETPILFFRAVTRQLLAHAEIATKKGIVAATEFDAPKQWLRVDPSSQEVTIWEGTEDQMTFITLGATGVRVVNKDISASDQPWDPGSGPYLKGPGHDVIDKYELDTLGVYPESIERLYLCHLFGRNVDPDKDLICGLELPREFKTYYEAISQ